MANRFLVREQTSSLLFSAATDRIDITSVAAQNNLTAFSFSCWFCPVSAGGGGLGRFFSKGSGSTFRYTMIFDLNRIELISGHGTQGKWDLNFSTQLKDAKWHFVCVTYDSSSLSNNAIFYYDGTTPSVITAQSPVGSLQADNTIFTIGNNSNNNRNFGGYLNDIKWFNRVLTSSEVSALYYNNSNPSNTLVGYWRLNENTGSTATDFTGNANGTITGATWSTYRQFGARSLV